MKILMLLLVTIGITKATIASTPINSQILSLLTKEIRVTRSTKTYYRDFVDSNGFTTRIIDSARFDSILASECLVFRIVDTFGIFNGLYGFNSKLNVEIIDSAISNKESVQNCIYVVSAVTTGRKNALAIAIRRLGLYEQKIYYFTIRNGNVELLDG